MVFGTIEQAIDDIRAGKFVIVADDEDRENEGDLICAAQLVTPEMVNFMIKKAGGMICLALTGDRVDALGLAPMARDYLDDYRTAYTVTIDASPRFGVTTGISAQDRATTIRVAVEPACGAGRPASRRTRLSAARPRRRRASARRPHGNGGRSGAARRAAAGRRDLRDPQRGRHHARRPQLDRSPTSTASRSSPSRSSSRTASRPSDSCIASPRRGFPPTSAT